MPGAPLLSTDPHWDIRSNLPLVDGWVHSSHVKSLLLRCSQRTLFLNDITVASGARCRTSLLEWDQSGRDPVLVLMDSDGGHAGGGRPLCDALRLMAAPTIGLVVGRAYSAACEVLQGCRLRLATSHSRLLAHHGTKEMAFKLRDGSNSDDDIRGLVRQSRTVQEDGDRASVALLVHRTGRSAEEIQSLLKQDRVLSAREAIGFGMLDAVVSEELEWAATR